MCELSASGSIARGSFLSQSQSEASQDDPELAADQSLPPLRRLQGGRSKVLISFSTLLEKISTHDDPGLVLVYLKLGIWRVSILSVLLEREKERECLEVTMSSLLTSSQYLPDLISCSQSPPKLADPPGKSELLRQPRALSNSR